jgi:glycosyltransferase involved in cell wall biosynthesis
MNVLMSGLSTDRVEINLARALVDAGISLTVIAAPDSAAVALCRDRGIPYTTHAFSSRIDRAAVNLYRDLIPKHRIDVVHNLTNRALSTALSATRITSQPPAVIAYRGTMGHLSWFDPASHFSYLNRRVDCIVCVSDAVRQYLKTFRIDDHRLDVIWKGHDPSWYTSSPRAALSEWKIPDDAVVVNFTGNIRPVKGVDYLLNAFASIAPEENIHLLVVGEVRDPSIRKRIGKQPHVHFAGFRRDATSLAGACDIAVMPSVEREGLPKSVSEAMAQGIPCIASDVGGLPELVENKVCGLLVPPRNSEAIRQAVRALARDSEGRKRMGAAARQRVEGVFNFRHTVEKTLALYTRLFASR